MAEDTFIREVDEQLRHDRAHEFWAKYRIFIIGAAVLVVLATAAIAAWEYYSSSQSAAMGDKYVDAIALSNAGQHEEAMKALETISAEGPAGYASLAKLRIAGESAAKGDKDAALKAFDAIAADSSAPEIFRNVATLRSGLLAVDLESYDAVEKRLSTLAAAGASFRHSAREALGISAMKAGNDQKAFEWFQAVSDDADASGGVRSRAQLMLKILAGKGITSKG